MIDGTLRLAQINPFALFVMPETMALELHFIYALSEFEFLIQGSQHPILLYTDHKTIPFLFTQKNKPNHRVNKGQLILKELPNLNVIWTKGNNPSVPDLLSCSLTTTTKDEHYLQTVENPGSVKFFMTHNQQTLLIQCYHALSKEYINAVPTDITVESTYSQILEFELL